MPGRTRHRASCRPASSSLMSLLHRRRAPTRACSGLRDRRRPGRHRRARGLVFDIAVSDAADGRDALHAQRGAGAHVTLPGYAVVLRDRLHRRRPQGPGRRPESRRSRVSRPLSRPSTHSVPARSSNHGDGIARTRRRSHAPTPTIDSTASPSVQPRQRRPAHRLGDRQRPRGARSTARRSTSASTAADDVRCAGHAGVRVARRALSGGRRRRDLGAVSRPRRTGTTSWIAAYSGDANNLPVSGACDAADESVLVHPPSPGTLPDPPARRARWHAGYCFGRGRDDRRHPVQKTIIGTAGADVIIGGPAGETIDGRGGNDLICAGRGNDKVSGGAGNDKIRGEAGNDKLTGEQRRRPAARQRRRRRPARRLRQRPRWPAATAPTGSTAAPATTCSTTRSSAAARQGPDPRRRRPGPHPHGRRRGRRRRLRGRPRHACCATPSDQASGAASGSRAARTRRSLPVARRRLLADRVLAARGGAGRRWSAAFLAAVRVSRLCWR